MKNLLALVLALGATRAMAGGFMCTDRPLEGTTEKTLAITAYVPISEETGTVDRYISIAISQGSLNNILASKKIIVGKKQESDTRYEYTNAAQEFSLVFEFDPSNLDAPAKGVLRAQFGGYEGSNDGHLSADVLCFVSVH